MPQFVYEAIEPSGRLVKGQIDAESASLVLNKLQSLNLSVVNVSEARTSSLSKLTKGGGGKVKLGSLVLFSRQFSTMVNAGIPILKSLDILEAQTKDPALKPV